jgi:hypothetical protein
MRDAGFEEKQAESPADASGEAELATKRDLELLRSDLRVGLDRIERKLIEHDGEFKLVKWMLGVVAGGIVALLLKSFLAG